MIVVGCGTGVEKCERGIFLSQKLGVFASSCISTTSSAMVEWMIQAGSGSASSNWSKTNPSRFSNCRLLMLYKGVKQLWEEFSPAEVGTFLLVA